MYHNIIKILLESALKIFLMYSCRVKKIFCLSFCDDYVIVFIKLALCYALHIWYFKNKQNNCFIYANTSYLSTKHWNFK